MTRTMALFDSGCIGLPCATGGRYWLEPAGVERIEYP